MGLFFNINFQSGLELHREVVIPNGDLLKPAFHQRLIEFRKVNDRRRRKDNKNYLTFMKSFITSGKKIFCKKYCLRLIRKYNTL